MSCWTEANRVLVVASASRASACSSAAERLFDLVQEHDARRHRVDNLESQARVLLALPDQTAHQSANVQYERGARGLIAEPLCQCAFSSSRHSEQQHAPWSQRCTRIRLSPQGALRTAAGGLVILLHALLRTHDHGHRKRGEVGERDVDGVQADVLRAPPGAAVEVDERLASTVGEHLDVAPGD